MGTARRGLWLPLVALMLFGATSDVHAGDAELAIAKRARPSVVRIRWRDVRFGDATSIRNAIVVRRDGLLLMAGPPPDRNGSLMARFSDGQEMKARIVAWDSETTLTLLRVDRTALPALAFRREKTPAPSKNASGRETDPARRLAMPPLGLAVVMVSGDRDVAIGAVRAHGRYGKVADPVTRKSVPTTGLISATLAGVDTDAGSPLLDREGKVVGLMVGRRAAVAPEAGTRAARQGLRLRPEPVEVVAVPAAVIELVWPLLEEERRVPRAGLGMGTTQADAALIEQLGLTGGGHIIRRIDAGGVAERFGLKLYDVIVSVNGAKLVPGMTMHDVLLPYRPGGRLKLGLIRQRQRVTVTLTLGQR